MNVNEALEYMKEHRDNIATSKQWVGWFSYSSPYVSFACPEIYPCCHDSFSEKDFLDIYADATFEKDE